MPKYLVVDDDESTVLGLSRLLQCDGHQVHAFTSGQDAVDALSQDSFDAVVTDLEMPGVTGDIVAQTAREYHPAACIIVNTGRIGKVMIDHACHVFDKPLDYESVTRAIAECRSRGGPGAHGRCYMRSALLTDDET